MPANSYIYKYALVLLCCAVFSVAVPGAVFGLSPRLETSSEISGEIKAGDFAFADCPAVFKNTFEHEWNRAADFSREMGVKRGDRVLVVGGSPMFLPIFLAVNGIDCTFVDVADLHVYTITELLTLYAQTSGDAGVLEHLHSHVSLFQTFDTNLEFDHVTMFDLFYMLKGGAPGKIIQKAVTCTKDSGTIWLARSYSSGFHSGHSDTEKLLSTWTPFGAFLSRAPSHNALINPDYPGGLFDSLNTAYTVRKDDKYHLLISA